MILAASSRKCYVHLCLCAIICLLDQHGVAASTSCHPAFVSPARHSCHDVVISPSHSTLSSQHNNNIQKSIALHAKSDKNEKASGSTSRSAREQGIYARPSAAIEKGSGFFIPGLEGSRIRFLFGITVLLADAANHYLVGSRPGDMGQVVAEFVSAFYGALLLLQGSIELGVERGLAQGGGGNGGIGSSGDENEDDILNRDNGSSSRIDDALRENGAAVKAVQRMAQTILTFTPATYFQFVAEDFGVLYSFSAGNDKVMAMDAEEQKILAKTALDAVSESRGGRVALPSEHPASKLLPESATRCILVQKVKEYGGSRACMIIGSDKLLPSFTKNDLRWMGQLAEYNNLMGDKSP